MTAEGASCATLPRAGRITAPWRPANASASTVATTGNVSYDAIGALVSGAWTVVRPHATVATTVANGTVVITVDDGNDGTIDHTWTFPLAQLGAAAG